jgi:replicative DNA helicase
VEEKKQQSGEEQFDSLLTKLQERQERVKSGKMNCIPVPFERTLTFFPGIERGTMTIVSASSGVGKSKFTRFLYVYHVYKYIKENPDVDIRARIFYFSLEESKERFFLNLISKWLFDNHGLKVGIKELLSIGKKGCYLSDEVLELIKDAKEYFVDFNNYFTVIDEVRNPTGFYLTVHDYLMKNGHWVMKKSIRESKEVDTKDYYVPDDPELYLIVIVDHISLMQPEKDNGVMMNLHQTISKWSSDYCINLRNQYGVSIVNVQQQSADKEKKQFNNKGGSIDEKLEPSLDGLADNKLTGRDADIVIGLFAPERYQIENYEGYDITKLQDNFRMLMFLKTRDGEANMRTPLFFDGKIGDFKELPKNNDTVNMKKVYEYVDKMR